MSARFPSQKDWWSGMDLRHYCDFLRRARQIAELNTGIAIHAVLIDIFVEAVQADAKTIVELGVSKEALANKMLTMAAILRDADVASCDLQDFSDVNEYPKWRFFKGHDIDFAKQWPEWAHDNGIRQEIDLLFVDTDELYDHVKQEIEAWFPYLAPNCTVMFRCTNLQKKLYYKDGSFTMKGWDNQRGVIRAVSEYFEEGWNETAEWSGKRGPWRVRHLPWGAGLTIMRRYQ